MEAADPFEIEEVDVRGVPTKVFKGAPSSLREIWLASEAFGPRDYLVYEGERTTYADAHERVQRLAQHLLAQGVQQGDRVAIAMRNYPEFPVAFWAIFSLGAVAVPLNAWWTGPELAYGISDSGAVLAILDDERAERLEPHLAELATVRQVVLVRSERSIQNSVRWAEALAASDAKPLPEVDIDPDDDASIMYTSGTTGKPKGAVQTHRCFSAFLMNMAYRTALAASAAPPPAPDAPPAPQMSTLLTFPLFHVGGLQSFLLPYTAQGGKITLQFKWDTAEALELIEQEGVTSVAGVPTTMFQLLELAAEKGKTLESLGQVSSGATLVPPELVRRIDTQLQSRAAPTNGYGLTETSGAAIANGGPAYVAKPDSVGLPISPVMDVKCVDLDGNTVAVGEVGEIWLKGPIVVRGYFGNEAATAASFTDGWFHTGDLGRLDEEGFLYVVDRLKDVIIRGGENIYAAEVEAALFEHPDITEAAIIGIPHDRLGEEVGAVVRQRDGAGLTSDAIRTWVGERLAAFKVPAHVWIQDTELPRNATGKVLKRQLRDELAPTS